MRPKINLKNIPERDRCQTPSYALDPVLQFIPQEAIIWESACGEGYLVKGLEQIGYKVIGTDLLHGEDYFQESPTEWDIQITNPPYSLKYEWLEKAYRYNKPFALLLPLDTLGSARAQKMFINNGMELILLNKRVAFKMPNTQWVSSPTFPAAWFTSGLKIDEQITYGKLEPRPEGQGHLLNEYYKTNSPIQKELI